MRGLPLVLSLIGAALLAFFVLLPLLGVVFVIVASVLVLAAVALFAAPLLMKLPWFRKRIRVDQDGFHRTVRFGNTVFTSYRGGAPQQPPYGDDADRRRLDNPDVIDVEGREIPDKD